MLGMMDMTADPCQDFYQYACGTWLMQNSPLDLKTNSWSIDSEIIEERDKNLRNLLQSSIKDKDVDSAERKMKTMYKKCMDLEKEDNTNMGPLRDIVRSLGGWAVDSKLMLYL